MTAGEYLRTTRKQRGLRLQDVADAYGCSIAYLSDIERSLRAVPKPRARRELLCEAYQANPITVDLLASRSEESLDVSDLDEDQRECIARLITDFRAARVAA